MKFLGDFLPIILFFVAYKLQGIYVATGVAIAASLLLVLYSYAKTRKVEKMQLITLVLIVVLGGATIFLHNELFIKWKPTMVNWLFAAAFGGSAFIGDKTLVERMLSHAVKLPEQIWQRLNLAWVAFFFLSGLINIFVLYNFDTDTWVNYKLFGNLGLTVMFIIIQTLYLSRHMEHPE